VTMADWEEEQQEDSQGEEDLLPSKSELKRRAHAVQALGMSLVELNDKQLAQMPIDRDDLLEAIAETKRIRSNSARKRHIQYIGKLMRDIDPQPLQRALDELYEGHRQATRDFHDLEALREQVLAAGTNGVDIVMERWPHADRQKLRQLVLQAERERSRNKPPAASRKLFKYLRELSGNAD